MSERRSKRISKRELLRCFDKVIYVASKHNSREVAFRWLNDMNHFLTKAIGIDKRLANEKLAREIGW